MQGAIRDETVEKEGSTEYATVEREVDGGWPPLTLEKKKNWGDFTPGLKRRSHGRENRLLLF